MNEKPEEHPSAGEPEHHHEGGRKMSPFGRLFRFLGWWLGFTGLYSQFAVCPFCGQPGCPVGMASAGTVGAFFALCVQDWKRFFAFLKGKWLVTVAALTLGAAAALTAGTAKASGALTKNDVLTIRNGRFYLAGKPFAEISFNKFDLFWQLYGLLKDGKGGTQEYRDMVAKQDQALHELHTMGFHSIRFFAAPWANLGFMPIFNDPVKRRTIFFKAMDTALDLCDKNDIKVVYSLGAGAFTDRKRVKNKWVYGPEQERELVADPNCRCRQELYRYIDAVVNRYKNRKTILMWEITNELTNQADISPGRNIYKGQRMPTLADVAHFFNDVAKRIKADDPLHLVNSGGSVLRATAWHQYTEHNWGRDTVAQQNKALDLLYGKSAVDVIDIHYYTNNRGICRMVKDANGQDVPMDLARYMEAARRIGKPLMLGETGSTPVARNNKPKDRRVYKETPDYHDSYWDPNAAKWVKKLCNEIVASGTQLAYFWAYSSDRPQDQRVPSWDIKKGKTDAVLAVIIAADKRLRAKFGVPARAE